MNRWLCYLATLLAFPCAHAADPPVFRAGAARVDISPTIAVRLMGYAARASLPAPTNIAQRIHARALALSHGPQTTVLITIDNCILPGALADEVRGRIRKRAGLPAENLAFTVTHTHSAPCLTGAAPNIFGTDIPPADQAGIDTYTRFLVDRLEAVVIEALEHRVPARVAWGVGRVTFAANRRTTGGPVDHDFPLMRVTGADGQLMAVLVSYACHCTTLGGELNAVHGDWAGAAALELEQLHPQAVALVAIGCGADANPAPRGTTALAAVHGHSIASEAERLLALPLTGLVDPPMARARTIALPYRTHFTRAEWEERAKTPGIVGHHARRWLARLDRGEVPPATLPYPIQTWTFGDRVALVFLGGEVVVDYSLRLKRELDSRRLWVNAYANDVPCYIPSRRILQEGGYEAETSLWYYDRPQRLAPETEDLIINTVKDLLPAGFRTPPKPTQVPPPRDPARALESFHLPAGLAIELAAGDDLVQSPVAIDFGPDGRLWVAEMFDYPSGAEGGGRVKVLEDTDGDGRYDRSTVVVRGLPFPTGLMQWRDGVLVCAAPDVRWFPGVASLRPGPDTGGEALLTGFATHNFQARVNGLRWGLDGWVYGAGGLFGGSVASARTGLITDANGRDFRWRPDTGEFQAEAGVSQQGRVRDDFGQWFGNDNSTLLWHFPLPAHYSRRNPHVRLPPSRVACNRDDARVFPISRTLERFNDPQAANQLTSACGPEIYRDIALGPDYAGNAFVCEPVHNLVRRAVLSPQGATFEARRAPSEAKSEFLTSSDNWFRPVEVRTGPDGALWVVDMYRFVVEHPRWIPPERLSELDVRAGADRGRIYRIRPASAHRPTPWRLDRLSPEALAGLINSPNGVVRDLAHRLLVEGRPGSATPAVVQQLHGLALNAAAGVRAQALAVLRDLDHEDPGAEQAALSAEDPRLRRFALTLFEAGTNNAPPPAALLGLADDPVAAVRFQLALTLGAFPQPQAAAALARLAGRAADDVWLRAAVLCSCLAEPVAFWRELTATAPPSVVGLYREPFLASVVGAGLMPPVAALLAEATPPPGASWDDARRRAALSLLATLEETPVFHSRLEANPETAPHLKRIAVELGSHAPGLARDPALSAELRVAAVRLMGGRARQNPADRNTLIELLDSTAPAAVRQSALKALGSVTNESVATRLIAGWPQRPPSRRAAVITLLLQRPLWTRDVLEAVGSGTIAPTEIPPAARDQLRRHREPAIAALATRVLPAPGGSRAEVLERFAKVGGLSGDPVRGGPHFEQLCVPCHQLRGIGVAVGPDLAPFRSKPVVDFVTAVLDPNAAIEPRFTAYTVTRRDGREQSGVIADETDTAVTLIQPGGTRETIPRRDVGQILAGARSLMPEGIEEGLQPQDLADLIAWIKRVPGPFGGATSEQSIANRRSLTAMGATRILKPASTAEALHYPSWLGRLPLHLCRQSDGQSRVSWTVLPVRLPDGTWRARLPAAFGFLSQPAGEFVLRVNGAETIHFGTTLSDTAWSDPDARWRLEYRVEEVNDEDSNGMLDLAFKGAVSGKRSPEWRCEVSGSAAGSQRWFGVYEWGE